jgi:hypothetical protein
MSSNKLEKLLHLVGWFIWNVFIINCKYQTVEGACTSRRRARWLLNLIEICPNLSYDQWEWCREMTWLKAYLCASLVCVDVFRQRKNKYSSTNQRDIKHFLKWKTTRCIIFQIYLIKYSTCFGQVHCLSSGVSQQCTHAIGICHAISVGCLLAWSSWPRQPTPTELAWKISIACVQCWDTPEDGQWTCPKHVEYFMK